MKKTKILGMSLPMLAGVGVLGYILYNKFIKKGVTTPRVVIPRPINIQTPPSQGQAGW